MNFHPRSPRRFTKRRKKLSASSCDFVDESLWRIYANTLARPALRRANVVEEPRVHFDCSAHAQFGHCREHGHLQCGKCRYAAPVAFQERRPSRPPQREQSRARLAKFQRLASELSRLARAQPDL